MFILDNHTSKKEMTEQCLYCHTHFDSFKWVSEHIHGIHYKSHICKQCGHENRIRVNFLGSGHDNWGKDIWTSIEEMNLLKGEFNQLLEEFNLNKVRR
ncbi:MAG: hypothetical protein QW594_03475 [Candidatus Woesearchaeota archaeon]